jgi:hypothetical protein
MLLFLIVRLPCEIHDSEERSGFNRGGSNAFVAKQQKTVSSI